MTFRQTGSMDYVFDDDPLRIQRDIVWQWLSTEAYWGRWRERSDFEKQLDGAWRVVGAYRADTGEQVAFARAVSDGVSFAYLADVFVIRGHQGAGIGTELVNRMIEDGPGRDFRWTLFTSDAHTLYEKFGFTDPGPTAMVRPAASGMR